MGRTFTFFILSCILMNFVPLQGSYGSWVSFCGPYSGFYVGGAGGIATHMSHINSFSSVTYIPEALTANILAHESDPHIFEVKPWGEIYLGWGACFACAPWVYLGARAGVNFSSWDLKYSTETSITRFDVSPGDEFFGSINTTIDTFLRTAEFTLDFKTGVVWRNTLLFAFVGGALNKMEQRLRSEFLFMDAAGDTFPALLSKKKERISHGLRVGGGLEHMIFPCLSVNVTYTYMLYHRVTIDGFVNVATNVDVVINGFEGKYAVKARRQVTSLGLSYYF